MTGRANEIDAAEALGLGTPEVRRVIDRDLDILRRHPQAALHAAITARGGITPDVYVAALARLNHERIITGSKRYRATRLEQTEAAEERRRDRWSGQ